MKKVKSLFLLLAICSAFAFSTKQTKVESGKVYWGISSYHNRHHYNGKVHGLSHEDASDVISGVGLASSIVAGMTWGSVFTPGIGTAAGAVVGL